MTNPEAGGEHLHRARRTMEFALFLAASTVGIDAVGHVFRDLTAGRAGIVALGWVAICATCFFVLVAQMGRVHDSWPRRKPAGEDRQSKPTPPRSGGYACVEPSHSITEEGSHR